jgi:Serine/Threonine/Tyrosine Kinase found in polyvalent proteins
VPDASSSKISQKKRRRTSPDSPKSAASFVRRSIASSRACGAARGYRFQLAALSRWAHNCRRVVGPDYFTDLKPVAARGEHSVFQSLDRKLAVKVTHPGKFGYSLHAEGLGATPLEYLERLEWQNHIFGDDIKLIGVTGEESLMGIVTSQPWISEPEFTPPPTECEIAEYLTSLRFRRFEVNPGVSMHFHRRYGIVVADLHVGNVLRSKGKLVPIDVVIGKPGPELRAKIWKLIGV